MYLLQELRLIRLKFCIVCVLKVVEYEGGNPKYFRKEFVTIADVKIDFTEKISVEKIKDWTAIGMPSWC